MKFWKSFTKVSSKSNLNFIPQEYKFWESKWVVWECPLGIQRSEKGKWDWVRWESMKVRGMKLGLSLPSHTNILEHKKNVLVTPTQWQVVAKKEIWFAGVFSLFCTLRPWVAIWPWPTPYPLSFLSDSNGRNENEFCCLGVSEEHHRMGEGEEERSGQPLLSLCWDRETVQVAPRGGLEEQSRAQPLLCLHPDPALYPCFLRNNYKTELKSISWSREWPVWKFSDVSELRLCQ